MKTRNTNTAADSPRAHFVAPQSTCKETEQPVPQGTGIFKHQTKQKAHQTVKFVLSCPFFFLTNALW